MTIPTDHRNYGLEFFGSEEARSAYSAAIGALHTFAKADGCPLGLDVLAWAMRRHEEYAVYIENQHRQADRPAEPLVKVSFTVNPAMLDDEASAGPILVGMVKRIIDR